MTEPTGNQSAQENNFSEEALSKMPHSELVLLRDKTTDKAQQELLAPYEHRAFAREYIGDSNAPGAAAKAVGILAAIPAYQLKKLVAQQEGETPASLKQMTESLKGTVEGVIEPWKRTWNGAVKEAKTISDAVTGTISPTASVEKPKMPWERVWGGGTTPAKITPPAASKAPPTTVSIPTERDMIKAAAFTPEEIRARDVEMRSPAFLKEMKDEIDSAKNPSVKKILQDEYNKLIKK